MNQSRGSRPSLRLAGPRTGRGSSGGMIMPKAIAGLRPCAGGLIGPSVSAVIGRRTVFGIPANMSLEHFPPRTARSTPPANPHPGRRPQWPARFALPSRAPSRSGRNLTRDRPSIALANFAYITVPGRPVANPDPAGGSKGLSRSALRQTSQMCSTATFVSPQPPESGTDKEQNQKRRNLQQYVVNKDLLRLRGPNKACRDEL